MDNAEVLLNNGQEQAPKERVFTQSELNEIVGRAKREAAESVRRQQQQHEAPRDVQSDDYIRKLASDELARQREAWAIEVQEKADAEAARKIVEAYKSKIAAGRQEYEDFDSVTSGLEMGRLPNVVQLLAEHADNASGVLYELAKNRTKLYTLENMCNVNPRDAIYEVKRLEKSLKSAMDADGYKQAKAPLSQQKPSPTTGMDSGKAMSVSDYKKIFRA